MKQPKGITTGYWVATSLSRCRLALIAHLAVGDDVAKWSWAAGTAVLWALSYFFFRKLAPADGRAMLEATIEKARHDKKERHDQGRIALPADRREDQGTGRLARQDALPCPRAHQSRQSPMWSRSGSGEAFRSGITME